LPIAMTQEQQALQASLRDWGIYLARTQVAERVLGLPR